MIAFCSACSVRWQLSRPSTIRMRQPTSSQWGIPEGLPLYPVVRIRLSRTITAPTARRGQVERVATSCAMRMKYSSHEGRTFLRVSWECAVSTEVSLKGSIEPVSGVAEAWDDERPLVKFRVDGCGVERYVRVLSGKALDAGYRGDGVEAGDPGRPLVLELVYGGREAPPRRQHRVEDEDKILLEVAREVYVVLNRLGGHLVALQAHEAHRRRRQEGEGPVEHTQSGAQHGYETDGAGNFLHFRLRKRRVDANLLCGHVARGLGDHDEGQLLHSLPEVRCPGPRVAKNGELVAAKRAVHDAQVFCVVDGLTHKVGTPPSGRLPCCAGHPSGRWSSPR